MARAKIFGVGFHKTGTQSLAEALTILGYDTIHGDAPNVPPYGDEGKTLIKLIESGDYNLPTIEKYEAFTDNPYFSIWRQLDAEYPGSKFILTIRESNQWIDSAIKYYKDRRVRPMRTWMFGDHANPASSPQAQKIWLEAYISHNKQVISYFKNRSQDLLVLNITEGDGWYKLCSFLDTDLPNIKFPYKNRTTEKKSNILSKINDQITRISFFNKNSHSK